MAKHTVALMEPAAAEPPAAPAESERDRLRRRASDTLDGRDLEQYLAYLDSPIDPRD
jgi:hypothetical protein